MRPCKHSEQLRRLCLVLFAHRLQGVEHRPGCRRHGSGGVSDANVPDAGLCGQRPRDEIASADDDGEFVSERDASTGCDEGLDLDGLVAVTGQEPGRVEPVPCQDVLDEIGSAAVVRPDPGVAGEFGWSYRRSPRERVAGGQQETDGVVEERLNEDSLRDRRRGEVVVEDNGQVKFTSAELAVGGVPVDEVIADVQVGVVLADDGGDFGGQLNQGAEERSQPDGAAG